MRGLRTEKEYGYTVVVVPRGLLNALRPFFKQSMPHRGRILRGSRHRRGPVLRDQAGLWH